VCVCVCVCVWVVVYAYSHLCYALNWATGSWWSWRDQKKCLCHKMYLMDTNMKRPRVRPAATTYIHSHIQTSTHGSNARNKPFKSFLIKSRTELNRWKRAHHTKILCYNDSVSVCVTMWFIFLSDEIHKFLLNFQFKVLKIYKDVIEDTIQLDDPMEKRKNKKINYLHIAKQRLRLFLLLWLSTTNRNSNSNTYLYLQVEAEATDTFLSQSHMPYILYLMSL